MGCSSALTEKCADLPAGNVFQSESSWRRGMLKDTTLSESVYVLGQPHLDHLVPTSSCSVHDLSDMVLLSWTAFCLH
ncbi:hypothetical protein BaRGS_00016164 [Batillaria attramentaria]|uniref:Uncharacterized protein n=1 Tax=Batillaria attramentaria TaxID=370345 RepID=A0ABD0L0P1_9CAEN